MEEGDSVRLMDMVGEGGPDDNGESLSSGHTNMGRLRCIGLKERVELSHRYSSAARAEAVGVKEPWAAYANGCRVGRDASAFTKSSVILDREEDTETARLRGWGRDSGGSFD